MKESGMMKEGWLRQWERKRELGKKTYVRRYGLFYFGMVAAVGTSLLELAFSASIETAYLVARFIIFPLFGMIGASIRWEANEKKYAAAVQQAGQAGKGKKPAAKGTKH
ncbi:hypothetical protein [Paenibacillus contaminans]|nr:hypothetical protein [Paenibacillus contaminans]